MITTSAPGTKDEWELQSAAVLTCGVAQWPGVRVLLSVAAATHDRVMNAVYWEDA